jgi:hypothetical protein
MRREEYCGTLATNAVRDTVRQVENTLINESPFRPPEKENLRSNKVKSISKTASKRHKICYNGYAGSCSQRYFDFGVMCGKERKNDRETPPYR